MCPASQGVMFYTKKIFAWNEGKGGGKEDRRGEGQGGRDGRKRKVDLDPLSFFMWLCDDHCLR